MTSDRQMFAQHFENCYVQKRAERAELGRGDHGLSEVVRHHETHHSGGGGIWRRLETTPFHCTPAEEASVSGVLHHQPSNESEHERDDADASSHR